MPVFAPLPSNGSVSSSVAGETACPIPNNAIWKLFALTAPPLHQRRSLPRPHQYFPAPSGKAVEIFRNSPKFPLDGLTQMSYGRGSDSPGAQALELLFGDLDRFRKRQTAGGRSHPELVIARDYLPAVLALIEDRDVKGGDGQGHGLGFSGLELDRFEGDRKST